MGILKRVSWNAVSRTSMSAAGRTKDAPHRSLLINILSVTQLIDRCIYVGAPSARHTSHAPPRQTHKRRLELTGLLIAPTTARNVADFLLSRHAIGFQSGGRCTTTVMYRSATMPFVNIFRLLSVKKKWANSERVKCTVESLDWWTVCAAQTNGAPIVVLEERKSQKCFEQTIDQRFEFDRMGKKN